MSDAQWYYADDGEQKGPIAKAELQRLIASRRVDADDLVWCEGMDDWLPAAQIPGLLEAKKKPKPVSKQESPAAESTKPSPAVTSSATKEPRKVGARKVEPAVETFEPLEEPESEEKDAPPMSLFAGAAMAKGTAKEADTPASEDWAGLGGGPAQESDEDEEEDEEYIPRPRFPAKRGHRAPERETTREVIREVVTEVVVADPASQISGGGKLLLMVLWAMTALLSVAAGVWFVAAIFDNHFGPEAAMPALWLTASFYLLSHSVQRCLELKSGRKHR